MSRSTRSSFNPRPNRARNSRPAEGRAPVTPTPAAAPPQPTAGADRAAAPPAARPPSPDAPTRPAPRPAPARTGPPSPPQAGDEALLGQQLGRPRHAVPREQPVRRLPAGLQLGQHRRRQPIGND